MPSRWIALSILFALPCAALAQPAVPNRAQMLETTLRNWEESMAKLDRFAVTCRRTTTDKVFGTVETYAGSALFLKGASGQPSQAYLKMTSTKDAKQYEEFLYTGRQLYVWLPATNVLQVHDVPPRKPGQPLIDDNIMALLFGVTAAAAREHYQLEWLPDPRKLHQYIRIQPRRPADRAEFTEAQLSLTADFLPRRISYFQPNGNVIQWDFEDLKKNDAARITPAAFATPRNPAPGWRIERVAPAGIAPAAGVAPKR